MYIILKIIIDVCRKKRRLKVTGRSELESRVGERRYIRRRKKAIYTCLCTEKLTWTPPNRIWESANHGMGQHTSSVSWFRC